MAKLISNHFLYATLGWLCVVLGFIGAFLPVMPTTVFIIIAAWAFSKSSERWYLWLKQHHIFGESLKAWEQHHAIPEKAKYIALTMLLLSYLFSASIMGPFSIPGIITGCCIVAVALYLNQLPIIR
ncbi:MAG: YbaN family protein [Gammaproteobacteria bacterium]|nr:YbaN family protein [Gammaproteobacteria bacterium]